MNNTNPHALNTPSSALVPFHSSYLVLVDHNGEPYVAMRPVVEGMGLDWKSQSVKLLHHPKFNCGDITTVAEDGKKRVMTCMPLRKMNGWLFSINPNRVRPDKRELVIRYQEECFAVLHDYWTKGAALNPRFEPPTFEPPQAPQPNHGLPWDPNNPLDFILKAPLMGKGGRA